MADLSKENVDLITQAVIKTGESKAAGGVRLSDTEWFSIFKNPESKKDGEIDVVLMNGCVSTPFMFVAHADDPDLLSVIEKNATRLLDEYHSELVIDELEPDF